MIVVMLMVVKAVMAQIAVLAVVGWQHWRDGVAMVVTQ